MGLWLFSTLKRERSQGSLCVFSAQTVPAALWRTGLLLSLLGWCSSLGEECVLGMVGQTVSLPCVQPHVTAAVNFSIEWRRGEEVVLRAVFREDGDVEEWSINRATTPADAALTGNFSLQLPDIDPSEDIMSYSLLVTSGQNQSREVCSRCLRTAASFSSPLLQRQELQPDGVTSFLCLSSGGFPEPSVYWIINNTEEPPEGSVTTTTTPLPDSLLYNVSSQLTVNVSKDISVSCVIENPSTNETWTSTNYGVKGSPVGSRASEAMWIFSTGLCAVVGLMVLVGVAYQIHLDRISKRKKNEYQKHKRGLRRRTLDMEETEEMKLEQKETDV